MEILVRLILELFGRRIRPLAFRCEVTRTIDSIPARKQIRWWFGRLMHLVPVFIVLVVLAGTRSQHFTATFYDMVALLLAALPALTICDLYKSRWQVELFFKWIKQHLRIKQFWIAVSVYVLAAIVRKRLKLDVSLYTLMQVFSVTVFEKASIESVIFQTADGSAYVTDDNQLNLFGY